MLVVIAVPYSLQCSDAYMLFQSSEPHPRIDALLVAVDVLYVLFCHCRFMFGCYYAVERSSCLLFCQ